MQIFLLVSNESIRSSGKNTFETHAKPETHTETHFKDFPNQSPSGVWLCGRAVKWLDFEPF